MPSLGSAAGSLGALVAHLKLDDAGLDKGATNAKRKLSSVRDEMRQLINTGGKVAVSLGAVGAALVVNLVDKAGAAAQQVQNLSRISNASTREFQRNAAAAKEFGVESSKLADIYKGMQDRVGDFLQTGGGPLLGFFEEIAPQVGVTAEQFAKLSGPQALQLYVNTLERANLSQSEMTFWMEKVAGDSSRLIPLLRDGGKEMERLGDNAERLGRVISDVNLERLAAGKRSLDDLRAAMAATSTQATAALAPAIQAIADGLNETLADALSDSEDDVVSWGEVVGDVLAFSADAATGAFATIGAGFKSAGTTLGAGVAQAVAMVKGEFGQAQRIGAEWFEDQQTIWSALANDTNLTRFRDKLEEIRNRQREIGGEGGAEVAGAAGGGGTVLGRVTPKDDLGEIGVYAQRRLTGPTVADLVSRAEQAELDRRLEQLREFVKSEEEILAEQHARRMELLGEQLEARNVTEEEYRTLREQLEAEHQDRLVALNKRTASTIEGLLEGSFRNRLQAGARFLTQMTAATATESKRMFELNKIAAIASAALDAKEAVLGAYKVGSKIGGPPLGAAFAAVAAAATAAQISAISSQQFGASSAAPSLAGGTAAPPVSPVGGGAGGTSRSVFIEGISEEQFFSGKTVRRLIEQISEEVGDGARIVVG